MGSHLCHVDRPDDGGRVVSVKSHSETALTLPPSLIAPSKLQLQMLPFNRRCNRAVLQAPVLVDVRPQVGTIPVLRDHWWLCRRQHGRRG
eukprot:2997334-Prymnesium_polylepis.1